MSNKITALIDRLVRSALTEAESSTGVRIKTERNLANEIALSLDEQEEEEEEAAEEETEAPPADDPEPVGDILDTEETAEEETGGGEEASAEVDVEVTDDSEPDASSKPKRKMSPPKVATGTSYKDFKHNFNIIRSARAISKPVNGEKMITKTGVRLRNYFEGLTGAEKQALQRFMVGLAQVLVVGKPAADATRPDIKKTEPEAVDVKVIEPEQTDVEIGENPPVRVVGSKLEGMMRSKRKLFT